MVRKIRETHVTNFTILNINRIMDLALQILLGFGFIDMFIGRTNLLLKEAVSFLAGKNIPLRLDDIFRFLSGIYFGWIC